MNMLARLCGVFCLAVGGAVGCASSVEQKSVENPAYSPEVRAYVDKNVSFQIEAYGSGEKRLGLLIPSGYQDLEMWVRNMLEDGAVAFFGVYNALKTSRGEALTEWGEWHYEVTGAADNAEAVVSFFRKNINEVLRTAYAALNGCLTVQGPIGCMPLGKPLAGSPALVQE